MKTIWEFLDDKFSTTDEKASLLKIQKTLEGDIFGGHTVYVLTPSVKQVLFKNPFRNQLFITSANTNLGTIYIGFEIAVSTSNYLYAMNKGDIFSPNNYKGQIFLLADTLGDKVTVGEW